MNTPLSQRIKELRTQQGVGVRELGRIIGKTGQHISNIEKGIGNPSAEVIVAIAKALNADKDELLHMAELVDPEVVGVIQKKPSSIPAFLRSAGDLSDEQWQELQAYAEKLKADS